jgi:hypothetical protein
MPDYLFAAHEKSVGDSVSGFLSRLSANSPLRSLHLFSVPMGRSDDGLVVPAGLTELIVDNCEELKLDLRLCYSSLESLHYSSPVESARDRGMSLLVKGAFYGAPKLRNLVLDVTGLGGASATELVGLVQPAPELVQHLSWRIKGTTPVSSWCGGAGQGSSRYLNLVSLCLIGCTEFQEALEPLLVCSKLKLIRITTPTASLVTSIFSATHTVVPSPTSDTPGVKACLVVNPHGWNQVILISGGASAVHGSAARQQHRSDFRQDLPGFCFLVSLGLILAV